jgi:hypothetical protein
MKPVPLIPKVDMILTGPANCVIFSEKTQKLAPDSASVSVSDGLIYKYIAILENSNLLKSYPSHSTHAPT